LKDLEAGYRDRLHRIRHAPVSGTVGVKESNNYLNWQKPAGSVFSNEQLRLLQEKTGEEEGSDKIAGLALFITLERVRGVWTYRTIDAYLKLQTWGYRLNTDYGYERRSASPEEQENADFGFITFRDGGLKELNDRIWENGRPFKYNRFRAWTWARLGIGIVATVAGFLLGSALGEALVLAGFWIALVIARNALVDIFSYLKAGCKPFTLRNVLSNTDKVRRRKLANDVFQSGLTSIPIVALKQFFTNPVAEMLGIGLAGNIVLDIVVISIVAGSMNYAQRKLRDYSPETAKIDFFRSFVMSVLAYISFFILFGLHLTPTVMFSAVGFAITRKVYGELWAAYAEQKEVRGNFVCNGYKDGGFTANDGEDVVEQAIPIGFKPFIERKLCLCSACCFFEGGENWGGMPYPVKADLEAKKIPLKAANDIIIVFFNLMEDQKTIYPYSYYTAYRCPALSTRIDHEKGKFFFAGACSIYGDCRIASGFPERTDKQARGCLYEEHLRGEMGYLYLVDPSSLMEVASPAARSALAGIKPRLVGVPGMEEKRQWYVFKPSFDDAVSIFRIEHDGGRGEELLAKMRLIRGMGASGDKSNVPALTAYLTDDENYLRMEAEAALDKLPLTSREKCAVYCAALPHAQGIRLRLMVERLEAIGHPDAIPHLAALMPGSDEYMAKFIYRTMDELGAGQVQKKEALRGLFRSARYQRVREWAGDGLAKMADESDLPMFVEGLGSRSYEVRRICASAIANLAPASEDIQRRLVELVLKDVSVDVRIECLYAIGRIRLLPDELLPSIEKLIASESEICEISIFDNHGQVIDIQKSPNPLYESACFAFSRLKEAQARLEAVRRHKFPIPEGLKAGLLSKAIRDHAIDPAEISDEGLCDFLRFLKENDCGNIVVFGGAVRDIFFGKQANDFDITVKYRCHPFERTAFTSVTASASEKVYEFSCSSMSGLADRLKFPAGDLLAGKSASFRGREVQYAGPIRSPFLGPEVIIKRFFVDSESRDGFSSTTGASLLQLAIDCDGRLYGNFRALDELAEGRAGIAGNGRNFGIGGVVRLLRLKHEFGLVIVDEDFAIMKAAVQASRQGRKLLPGESQVIERQLAKLKAGARSQAEVSGDLIELGLIDLFPGGIPDKDGGAVRQAAIMLLLVRMNGEHQVLLTKRAPGLPSEGEWVLPGGKLEPGECPREAAVRELYEETGIKLPIDRILVSLEPSLTTEGDFLIHPFVALIERLPAIRMLPSEVSDWQLVPLSTLVAATCASQRGPPSPAVPAFVSGKALEDLSRILLSPRSLQDAAINPLSSLDVRAALAAVSRDIVLQAYYPRLQSTDPFNTDPMFRVLNRSFLEAKAKGNGAVFPRGTVKTVGVFGYIGSAKTVVTALAEIIAPGKVTVISLDEIGRELRDRDPYQRMVIAEFGSGIRDASGRINSGLLGKIVFADKNKLNALNKILFPGMESEARARIRQARAQGRQLLLIEGAVLPQLRGLWEECDAAWLIESSPSVRMQRLGLTRFDDERVRKTEEQQRETIEAARLDKRTHPIANNGSVNTLAAAVAEEFKRLDAESLLLSHIRAKPVKGVGSLLQLPKKAFAGVDLKKTMMSLNDKGLIRKHDDGVMRITEEGEKALTEVKRLVFPAIMAEEGLGAQAAVVREQKNRVELEKKVVLVEQALLAFKDKGMTVGRASLQEHLRTERELVVSRESLRDILKEVYKRHPELRGTVLKRELTEKQQRRQRAGAWIEQRLKTAREKGEKLTRKEIREQLKAEAGIDEAGMWIKNVVWKICDQYPDLRWTVVRKHPETTEVVARNIGAERKIGIEWIEQCLRSTKEQGQTITRQEIYEKFKAETGLTRTLWWVKDILKDICKEHPDLRAVVVVRHKAVKVRANGTGKRGDQRRKAVSWIEQRLRAAQGKGETLTRKEIREGLKAETGLDRSKLWIDISIRDICAKYPELRKVLVRKHTAPKPVSEKIRDRVTDQEIKDVLSRAKTNKEVFKLLKATHPKANYQAFLRRIKYSDDLRTYREALAVARGKELDDLVFKRLSEAKKTHGKVNMLVLREMLKDLIIAYKVPAFVKSAIALHPELEGLVHLRRKPSAAKGTPYDTEKKDTEELRKKLMETAWFEARESLKRTGSVAASIGELHKKYPAFSAYALYIEGKLNPSIRLNEQAPGDEIAWEELLTDAGLLAEWEGMGPGERNLFGAMLQYKGYIAAAEALHLTKAGVKWMVLQDIKKDFPRAHSYIKRYFQRKSPVREYKKPVYETRKKEITRLLFRIKARDGSSTCADILKELEGIGIKRSLPTGYKLIAAAIKDNPELAGLIGKGGKGLKRTGSAQDDS
ncbi:MAG: dephospho-CoA kinase, partial [Deltaproteobacteria bacterium]